ncbi:MAG: AtpZ/AtpI family protein [Parcubacteria group bacterium]|nr:AtpZ/AtpI family protein [Parcubacteria group bacterium]
MDMYQTVTRILGTMTGWILAPALLGGFLGMWLDEKYGTTPWLFLLILGFSFIISIVGVARIAIREFRRLDEDEKEKTHTDTAPLL